MLLNFLLVFGLVLIALNLFLFIKYIINEKKSFPSILFYGVGSILIPYVTGVSLGGGLSNLEMRVYIVIIVGLLIQILTSFLLLTKFK